MTSTSEYFLVYFTDVDKYDQYPHKLKLYTSAEKAYNDLYQFMQTTWDPITRTGEYKPYRLDEASKINEYMANISQLNVYTDEDAYIFMLKVTMA